MRDLDSQERRVLGLLGEAWNAFAALAPAHPHDADDFVHAIHAAQNIVLARPATEERRVQ